MCLEIQKTEPRNGARHRLEGGIKEFLDFILAAGVKRHLRGSSKSGPAFQKNRKIRRD